MTIICEIVTQERMVYNKAVDAINLPGIEGRLGILPNHAPLLTVLDFGEVILRIDGEEEYYAIGGGIAEVNPDKVIILADSADHFSEIDEQRAEEARQAAQKAMDETEVQDPEVYRRLELAIRQESLRVDVARRRRDARRRNAPVPDLTPSDN